ncbi:hypothetical protein [Roseateles asaccharophilus]|uniref:Uncharacterized protein n=1 Tax=Roseateles asaccharophilus TaxID=582607 RepID=A0ABU2AAW9_9BURK|nr:hypothetical protein [Roseateles asaccharophilus]MDR7334314.1 hypothetical protein [Roseateles asaccharophilus]
MGDISSSAYALKQLASARGRRISTGHAQQLIAALFGHQTLAAFQASGDADKLRDAVYLLADIDLAEGRAAELGLFDDDIQLALQAIASELQVSVHQDWDDLVIALQQAVDEQVLNDGEVISQTAMTNGVAPEADLPLDGLGDFNLDDDDSIDEELNGLVVVEQDPDRVYYGHEVKVQAKLDVARLGSRLFGEAQVRVIHAKLKWGGADDDEDNPPQVPENQAIADLLGFSVEEVDELDWEINPELSEDEFVFGHSIDFSASPPGPAKDKLAALHPDLTVWVDAGFMDNVARDY